MYFQKLKKIFLDPSKFFKDVSKEKGYWNVLKVFVTIYVAALIIQVGVGAIINRSLLGSQFVSFIFTTLIAGIVAAFVVPFIGGGIAHLGILIIGGRKGFFNTFKPVTYGGLVMIIYGVVSSIISGVALLISPGSAPIIGVIVGGVSVIGIIHTLVVQTMGVSKSQSLSTGKAFFGLILIPLIMVILLLAIGSTAINSFIR